MPSTSPQPCQARPPHPCKPAPSTAPQCDVAGVREVPALVTNRCFAWKAALRREILRGRCRTPWGGAAGAASALRSALLSAYRSLCPYAALDGHATVPLSVEQPLVVNRRPLGLSRGPS